MKAFGYHKNIQLYNSSLQHFRSINLWAKLYNVLRERGRERLFLLLIFSVWEIAKYWYMFYRYKKPRFLSLFYLKVTTLNQGLTMNSMCGPSLTVLALNLKMATGEKIDYINFSLVMKICFIYSIKITHTKIINKPACFPTLLWIILILFSKTSFWDWNLNKTFTNCKSCLESAVNYMIWLKIKFRSFFFSICINTTMNIQGKLLIIYNFVKYIFLKKNC